MTLKYLYGLLATPWYWIRPLDPRHQSREAFIAHLRAKGKADGSKP